MIDKLPISSLNNSKGLEGKVLDFGGLNYDLCFMISSLYQVS